MTRAETPPSRQTQTSAPARLREFFWRGEALAENARATEDAPSSPCARARSLLDAASELDPERDARAVVELDRQAARLVLRPNEEDVPLASVLDDEPTRARVDDAARDAGARARDTLFHPGETVSASDARAAHALTKALVDKLDARTVREVVLLRERVIRTGTLLASFGLVVALAVFGPRFFRVDLARNATWRTSSTSAGLPGAGRGGRNPSPQNEHDTMLLFHTAAEPSPWIEFDLGAVHAIHRVRIVNRADCCWERAAPLAVEASTDGQSWTELARRDDVFYDWRRSFPSHRARFVRIRALHYTQLHLDVVEIN